MVKKIVTAEELAVQLSLTPRTIRAWALQKKIPSLRISPKVIRFNLDAVQQALNKNFQAKPKLPKRASILSGASR